MKRSRINALIAQAMERFEAHGYRLPPFAFWTPAQWRRMGRQADEIRQARLGWDLTDFGSGDFDRTGLLLFTVRNGAPGGQGHKTYCEKIMVVAPGQVTPMHYHIHKTEDIINRGGGDLVCQCHHATVDDALDVSSPVVLSGDGVRRELGPGQLLTLAPGESVTLTQRMYHRFCGRVGGEPVMVGEVSKVNDDRTDNRFLDPIGRFPTIEEDAEPRWLLCHEYPPAD